MMLNITLIEQIRKQTTPADKKSFENTRKHLDFKTENFIPKWVKSRIQ